MNLFAVTINNDYLSICLKEENNLQVLALGKQGM
jgi:hypothetical protein